LPSGAAMLPRRGCFIPICRTGTSNYLYPANFTEGMAKKRSAALTLRLRSSCATQHSI
jgi:hypothetical protein